MHRIAVILLVVVSCGAMLPGDRTDYPTDYFRSPIGIPILLSGSFSEMRSNHFHSGLDIKTNGKQGYRTYAVASGYVSRIKVSPTGFGNALYVRHRNGYTSVYAHLRNFKGAIQNYVKTQQYRAKKFAVDLYPDKGLFPVSKGEVLAFSGNSGGSGGPHLHFEIRDSRTEWPLNPLLFGLDLKDDQAPEIRRIKVYAMDVDSGAEIVLTNGGVRTAGYRDPALLRVTRESGKYVLRGVRSIRATGNIGFGIETRDSHNGSRSRLGAFIISLSANGSRVFEYVAEKFSFDHSRYINAHVDYEERERNERWVQRSYLLPGNKLPSYRGVVNMGIIEVESGDTYAMQYEVSDVNGNVSRLSFQLNGAANLILKGKGVADGELVRLGSKVMINRPGMRADLGAETFYEDTRLTYSRRPGDAETFSPRHKLHNDLVPVHSRYLMSIEAENLPAGKRSVVTMAHVDREGRVSMSPGKYKDGWVSARVRTLGEFFVSADSTSPTIRAINISDGRNLRRASNIRFRIRDADTGINSYTGSIDGKWVLFEYDAKTGMLVHTFDGRVGKGNHQLQLRVTDAVGNIAMYEVDFRR